MQYLLLHLFLVGCPAKAVMNSCSRPRRGHKTMTALAAALESQWGEAHRQSGRRMALWSAHVSAAAPTLCWGALSHPDVLVRCRIPWGPLMILVWKYWYTGNGYHPRC